MYLRTFWTSLILSVIVAAAWCSESQADINCAADIAGCCCRGIRGNVDCDFNDVTDILDLAVLIDHLYISLAPLPSYDEANIDGKDQIDISDVTALIDYLYIHLTPPANCPGGFINHPPVTSIVMIDSGLQPYVNTVTPFAGNPGVHYSWIGTDKADHPYDSADLSYEWRVYGPYDSLTMAAVSSQFVTSVFITPTGQMYRKGHGYKFTYCDTIWIPTPPYLQITCRDLLIDTVHVSNAFGTLDTIFDVDNPAFAQNSSFNTIALHSGTAGDWTTSDTSAFLRDFFHDSPSDTTRIEYCVFWVRAIDHDPSPLADLAPAFKSFPIADAKHELDVLIADAMISYTINPAILARAKLYWDGALYHWNPFVKYKWHTISQSSGNVLPLKLLLQHKIVIALSDDVIKGVLNTVDITKKVIAASTNQTSFWVCGRTSIAGDEAMSPRTYTTFHIGAIGPWMGISTFPYSGWDYYALFFEPSKRIEDFVGADPTLPFGWPSLTVDSSYLHKRYGWGGGTYFPWIDTLAALPEVTYFTPTTDAEILYTYRSKYVGHHPIVPDSMFFAGKPVVYRIERGTSRLFVSAFTPLSLAGDNYGGASQVFVDSTLNWLSIPFNTVMYESVKPGGVKPSAPPGSFDKESPVEGRKQ